LRPPKRVIDERHRVGAGAAVGLGELQRLLQEPVRPFALISAD
jgi:hypothetical protein